MERIKIPFESINETVFMLKSSQISKISLFFLEKIS